MSNPWKTASAPVEVQSLSQIILEETLRSRKVNKEIKDSIKVLPEIKDSTKSNNQDMCDSDATIAEVLQEQYDKDELRTRLEKKNIKSKLSSSYNKYFNVPPHLVDYDSDCDDTNIDSESQDLERFEAHVKEFGFYLKAKNSVLKNLKQNIEKVNPKEKLILERNTHIRAVIGLHKETRLILFQIMDRGVLDEINGVIATGHKSVVFHAMGNIFCDIVRVPLECAVKVYKTKVDEFKQRDTCIDSSVNDVMFMMEPDEKVHVLAEKEMSNLIHMRKFGINCPEMVCFKKHVLVMSLVGKNTKPALSLYELGKESNWQDIYNKIVDSMFKLYNEAGMVHADLTPANILWWNEECWFIDVSQAVHTDNPYCLQLLLRDCENVTDFFDDNDKKIDGFKKTGEELFKYITGHDFTPSSKLNDDIESFP